MSTGVSVHGLSKRFSTGERHDSLRDLVPALVRRVRRVPSPSREGNEFWALRDVSFAVAPGEALGIIGPNGAGKSTMLKLLTRILRPTAGRCEVHGRVGALIELAAAFHGDLTGRENVFLQAAIMGMRAREVKLVLDDIIAFAGVEAFIDTPVKRYSSGMHARLGFSVAAHLDPEVLIIDEVLAVGDMAFQEKCIARMKLFKQRGTAIVFVSHNLQAVSELCDRALYLQSTVRALGKPRDVIGAYVSAAAQQEIQPSGGVIDIVASRVFDARGPLTEAISPGAPLWLELDCVGREAIGDLQLRIQLHRSSDGLVIYRGVADDQELRLGTLESGERFTLCFGFRAHVGGGHYHFACQIYHNPTQQPLARLNPAGMLSVLDSRTGRGITDLEMTCDAR